MSGELLSNSGELFHRRRSSLAKGEHTIAFVSSIPFRFAIQSTVSWLFSSNPLCLLSVSVPLEPASMAEPPRRPIPTFSVVLHRW
jgi:hypothetical protein